MVLPAALVTSFLGWLVVERWLRGGWLAGLSIGFAAGAGVLSLQLLAYSLLRVPWKLPVVLAPWLAVAVWRLRGRRLAFVPPAAPHWIEVAALVCMLAAPVLWLPYERTMPLSTRGWDAWAIWLFKAKAFYLDGNVQGYLARAAEFNSQPSYPLLTPLYGAFLLLFGGSDQAAKALSPLFFFALLGGFYHLAGRFASRPVALVFTALLANLHMVNITAFELAGYADTTLSVYLLLGAGYLYAWWREDQAGDLALASLFASLAAWTKNEGLFFLGAVAGILLIRRARWTALVGPALAVGGWMALRRAYDVPGSDLWAGRLNWANLAPGLASFAAAFNLGRYNLTFWLLGAALLLYRRVGLDRRWLLLPGLVAWQLAGLLGAYLAGRNDLQWWIGTSLDRILAQVAPLALLAAALVAAPAAANLTPPETSRNLKTKRPRKK